MQLLSPDEAMSLLRAHPRLRAATALDRPGFSLPGFPGPVARCVLGSAPPPELTALGLRVEGTMEGNALLFDPATPFAAGLRLRFIGRGARNNLLVLGPAPRVRADLAVSGADNCLVLGDTEGKVALRLTVRGDNCLFLAGAGMSANEANILLQGEGRSIVIGDDCMASSGVAIRNSDSHAIIDLEAAEQVNPPRDVEIGEHVWLANGAVVLKGVRIGAGCIVAARALVSRDLPPCCLGAGMPARVIRRGVTWSRRLTPSRAEIAALVKRFEARSGSAAAEQLPRGGGVGGDLGL
ncbi:acyltransferase [Teichococcus coralli]|nr:acyltransferase [Pseudoroseomonas coralli]